MCISYYAACVAFEVRLSPSVCWCTCGRYGPVRRRFLLVCLGVGVWCVVVGGHIARRVAIAQEYKMITFVVCEIAEERMVISASDARQLLPNSVAPASDYWEVVGVDGSYWGRRHRAPGRVWFEGVSNVCLRRLDCTRTIVAL